MRSGSAVVEWYLGGLAVLLSGGRRSGNDESAEGRGVDESVIAARRNVALFQRTFRPSLQANTQQIHFDLDPK